MEEEQRNYMAKEIDPNKIYSAVRGCLEANISELNGLAQRITDPGIKADIEKLRGEVNTKLAALPPMEQVPAAQDFGWAFQRLNDVVESFSSLFKNLIGKMDSITTVNGGLSLELNGLKGKLTEKKLLTVEEANSARDLAVAQANQDATGREGLLKAKLAELSGLPAAPANVLALPVAEFNGRIDQAKTNIAAMGRRGLKLGGKADKAVIHTAWMSKDEFNAYVELNAGIMPAEEAAPVAAPAADPLCGGPGTIAPARKKMVMA
jgi:hypothetical protein